MRPYADTVWIDDTSKKAEVTPYWVGCVEDLLVENGGLEAGPGDAVSDSLLGGDYPRMRWIWSGRRRRR